MTFLLIATALCICHLVSIEALSVENPYNYRNDEEKKTVSSTCDPPRRVLHGYWNCIIHTRHLEDGRPQKGYRQCTVTCHIGYSRRGPEGLVCRDSWNLVDPSGNGEFPTCELETSSLQPTTTDSHFPDKRRWRELGNNRIGEQSQIRSQCSKGYVLSSDARKCEDINECARKDLNQCSHGCQNFPGGYKCHCSSGYRLLHGKQCEDIDECESKECNLCSHVCQNVPGSYSCSCPQGYWLVDDKRCKGCPKNAYKLDGEERCLECPQNSYTDSEGKISINDCVCYSGFKRNLTHISCRDIDECQVENFGCSHSCINTPGSVHCSCPDGFELSQDNKTCIDIDECSLSNGGCEGSCSNTIGSFNCSCPSGFTSSQTDVYRCIDIDECAMTSGLCSQKCINYPGGYYCTCNEGYRLDGRGERCIPVVCPHFLEPRHSHMKCYSPHKDGSRNAVKDVAFHLNDTHCRFWCRRGFKAKQATPGITCKDGEWVGSIPECVALKCPPLAKPANGDIHPGYCSSNGVKVKQKCVVTCNPGYQLKTPRAYVCKNNLTWNREELPACEAIRLSPHIACPPDIVRDLPVGKSSLLLKVPTPTANWEYQVQQPEWATVGQSAEFPAGQTDVMFVVVDPNPRGRNDSCVTSIFVMDSEPPVITGCPTSFEVHASDGHGAVVQWKEPEISDNVRLHLVTKSLEPNTTLTPGTHTIEYVASDEAGNFASCSFHVQVTSPECGDPIGPRNGESNCLEMFYGKLCDPICDPGYMRLADGEDEIHVCNSEGQWQPSNVISDCLEFYLKPSSDCKDLFESRTLNDTGEVICIQCPAPAMRWSPTSRRCETLPHPVEL